MDGRACSVRMVRDRGNRRDIQPGTGRHLGDRLPHRVDLLWIERGALGPERFQLGGEKAGIVTRAGLPDIQYFTSVQGTCIYMLLPALS